MKAVWAVRRYSPSPCVAYSDLSRIVTVPSMVPNGKEQVFDSWRDVCLAADTIIGGHELLIGNQPADPVVINHGDDVVIIYTKLEL